MSAPKFIALNPETGFGDGDDIAYYGESDRSMFGALQDFKKTHFTDVAKALGVKPGDTIQVDVWSSIAFEDSELFDPDYPGTEADRADWVLHEIKGTSHLVWAG